MSKYAQIVNGKVSCISEMTKDIIKTFHPSIVHIEIKNQECEVGFLFDEKTKEFKKDVVAEQIKVDTHKKYLLAYNKTLAQSKIVSTLSDNHQCNSLYKLYKHGKKAKSSLTSDEKAEIADLESKWEKIESIGEASNRIEAEIYNLQTMEDLQTYDVQNNPLWP